MNGYGHALSLPAGQGDLRTGAVCRSHPPGAPGELGADDLVRADWDEDWHPAASVVGLFYMARRPDVLARWEAEHARAQAGGEFNTAELEAMLHAAESVQEVVGHDPIGAARMVNSGYETVLCIEPLCPADESALPAAIDEALAAAESKDRHHAVVRSRLCSRDLLRCGFCWGMSLLAANLVGLAVATWSAGQAQRYPSELQRSADIRAFPLWGACRSGQYAVLLVGTMGAGGVAGYAGARLLEARCED